MNEGDPPIARGDDIEDRLVAFAVRILKLSSSLPKTAAGRHISGQVVRSGTSPAPNYAEARGAESRKNFIHKLKISLKELNETRIWLRIIVESEMLPAHLVTDLQNECDELCRIIATSFKTASTQPSR